MGRHSQGLVAIRRLQNRLSIAGTTQAQIRKSLHFGGFSCLWEDLMEENNKGLALLAQVARGLIAHDAQQTTAQLGDRTSYVGMSDIGKGAECLRAAVAGKLNLHQKPTMQDIAEWFRAGNYDRIRSTLRRNLILQRGHWMENGFAKVLNANGAHLLHQLEIAVEHDGVPIRAHLDFTLVWGWPRPAIRILELKTTERIPVTLYTGYETQLYGQLGLLKTYWAKPVFAMRDADGSVVFEHLTFPQAAKLVFGISLPREADNLDMEGWVLCLSMSDARAFGPYRPDTAMLGMCQRIAGDIWTTTHQIQTGETALSSVPYCTGFHPLCDWCDHAEGCPKFTAQALDDPAYDQSLEDLADLKASKAYLEEAISTEEERIRCFYAAMTAVGDSPGWLQTAGFRFKVVEQAGRKSIESAKLDAELRNELGDEEAESLLARITKTGKPSHRLYVSPRISHQSQGMTP